MRIGNGKQRIGDGEREFEIVRGKICQLLIRIEIIMLICALFCECLYRPIDFKLQALTRIFLQASQ